MTRGLFPATFDPIHNGHIDIVNRASKFFDEVIVGVYDRPIKSLLFSPEERISLVKEAFKGRKNIVVTGFSGLTVDYCKEIDAQVIIRGLRVFSDFEYEFRLALANRELDADLETIALITSKEHTFLSSTTVREIALLGGNVSTMVPKHVKLALEKKYLEISPEDIQNGF